MIDPQKLAEFRRIYLEEFKIALSDEEAVSLAADLLDVLRILCRSPL